MAPGMFVFISAKAANMSDKATFGTKTVSATSFISRIMRSANDVKVWTNFDNALIQSAFFKEQKQIDEESIKRLKNVQQGLRGDGSFIIEQWTEMDNKYEEAVKKIQKRLDHKHFHTPEEPQ